MQQVRTNKETALIDEALRIVIDTEGLSSETTKHVISQTGQLEQISLEVDTFNVEVGSAKNTLSSMKRRIITNKLICCVSIAFLILGLIGVSVYLVMTTPK